MGENSSNLVKCKKLFATFYVCFWCGHFLARKFHKDGLFSMGKIKQMSRLSDIAKEHIFKTWGWLHGFDRINLVTSQITEKSKCVHT